MSDETSAASASALIERAHVAFLATRNVAPSTRAAWLVAIADGLDAGVDALVAIAIEETHLAESRLRGELLRTSFQLRLFAREICAGKHFDAVIDHSDPEWGMGPRPDIRRFNVPLGVVGVFGASNFPFAFSVIGGDSASALASGSTVIHKLHSAHRVLGLATADIVAEALAQAGADPAVFAVVTGREAAGTLVDHRLVKAIGFTGSTSGGRALYNRAAARDEPIPFYGELGSINPVFVTERAWEQRASEIVAGFAASFTSGMGQFCTKPGIIFIPVGSTTRFHEDLGRELQGFASSPMLSPPLRESFAHSVREEIAESGVETVIAGLDSGLVPTPIVLSATADAVLANPSIVHREMFGPATLVVTYQAEEQIASLVECLEGQLTTTIFAEVDEDMTVLSDALREKSGRVLWNAWPTGVTVSYAQQHGGPYPASTFSGATSVGTAAISRFMRPVAFQNFPQSQLPEPLRDENSWGIPRRIDGSTS